MTNLTEQWKNGELESGWYYVNHRTIDVKTIDYYHNGQWRYAKYQDIIDSTLAPVPSYEEWEKLNWYAGNGVEENQELKMENAQLKELLISAKDIIEWYSTESGYIDLPTKDLLTKIDEVLK